MSKTETTVLCLISVLLLSLPNLSWAWSGKVVKISDGDTIKVLRDQEHIKILLYGIETPEKGQAFGKKAKQFTSDMVFGKVVEVEVMDHDRYGRTVALVFVDKILLNKELVKAGLAWVYWKYCHHPICESWKSFQLTAKVNKQGLWADPKPVPPWDFRRKKRK